MNKWRCSELNRITADISKLLEFHEVGVWFYIGCAESWTLSLVRGGRGIMVGCVDVGTGIVSADCNL